MPLPESIADLGRRLEVNGEQTHAGASFVLYVYPPKDEWRVRRDLNDLRLWLEARGVTCVSISLAELMWEALEAGGWYADLVAAERDQPGDPSVLHDVVRSVAEVLRQPPTLADRVIERLADAPEGCVVFLYRAGALYPAFRTSALLEDLQGRLSRPVVLLYPGRQVGSHGLSFMDRCESAYGYRATIVPRGENE
ncbi:MAG TPA: BREX protein BrxB domain-containing protein [Solirubrobacteraceae bacterium]|jgi:hypothetical protein